MASQNRRMAAQCLSAYPPFTCHERAAWIVFCPTTVKGAAITAALRKSQTLSAWEVVAFSDSQSALQRVHWRLPHETYTRQSLALYKHLIGKSFNVKFQWIPFYVGIKGNEKADALVCEARTCVGILRAYKTYQNSKNVIGNHFMAAHKFPHQSCVIHENSRKYKQRCFTG